MSFGYIVCSACWTTVKIALTPSAVLSSGGRLHVGTYNAGVSTQIHPYLPSCSYLPSRGCGIADSWGPGQQPAGRGKGMRSHKSALVEHWFFCSHERYVWSSLSQGEPGFRVNLTVPLSLPTGWGGREGVSCSIFLLQASMSSLLVPWSPLTPSQRSNHVSLTVGVPIGLMLGTPSSWQASVQKAVSSLDGLSEQTSLRPPVFLAPSSPYFHVTKSLGEIPQALGLQAWSSSHLLGINGKHPTDDGVDLGRMRITAIPYLSPFILFRF